VTLLPNSNICRIVAPKLDIHAFAIMQAGDGLDVEFLVLDTAEFPRDLALWTNIRDDRTSGEIRLSNGRELDLANVISLWWRRPQSPNVDGLVEASFVDFATHEGRQALFGTFNALIPRVFNQPHLSSAANQKVAQLAIAKSIGLTVPETLITNDQSAVKDFYAACRGEVVYKIFRSPDIGLYPTNRLKTRDLTEISSLSVCPCIFQRHIRGEHDVRVTIVAGKCFAARIDYDVDSEVVDTRLTGAAVKPITIPTQLESMLIDLMNVFGLVYGAQT
jgi:hypothetical protein